MLKRILILFSLVFLISCSCGEDNAKSKRANAQKEYKERLTKKVEEVKKSNVDERFIYDIGGEIFKKVYRKDWDDYFFYIKLDNGGLIEWETKAIKYHSKEVGDRVHFEFLRTDRFSDKAID